MEGTTKILARNLRLRPVTAQIQAPVDDGRNVRVTGDPLRHGDWYLEAYKSPTIHQSMIKDRVRTETYRKAIDFNQHKIKVSARSVSMCLKV